MPLTIPRTAYDLMRERCQAQDRRLNRVALARPVPVRETVALRAAADVPFTPPAVSILAPKPETAADVHAFVVQEFREAQAKMKQIAR